MRGSALSEYDNAVGIGTFEVIIDAPAIGGFGEFLIVDDHEHRLEAGGDAARQNRLFELGLAAMHLADLEGDVPAAIVGVNSTW